MGIGLEIGANHRGPVVVGYRPGRSPDLGEVEASGFDPKRISERRSVAWSIKQFLHNERNFRLVENHSDSDEVGVVKNLVRKQRRQANLTLF